MRRWATAHLPSIALFVGLLVLWQLAATSLARYHFLISASGSVLLPIGIGLAVLKNSPGVAILGALLWLVGVLMFLVQLIRLAGDRTPAAAVQPAE